MIEYGVALFAVCALSLLDKRAMPYALTLSAGWLAGFAGYEWWPTISVASGCVMAWLLSRHSPLWAVIIACCIPLMLICDAAYLWGLSNNVYWGEQYAATLDKLLQVQILAAGWPGGRRGVRLLVERINRPSGVGLGDSVARSDSRKGPEAP